MTSAEQMVIPLEFAGPASTADKEQSRGTNLDSPDGQVVHWQVQTPYAVVTTPRALESLRALCS